MRRKNSTAPERGVENQTITVGGLGTAGGDYKTRVRATTHEGIHSPWTEDVEFTLTDAAEGTASDPNLPDVPSNLALFAMLNAILVKFSDEFNGDNPLMAHNTGLYEIQISNASNLFPATGNEWTFTIASQESDYVSEDVKTFKVPTGDGFVCGGLKSESGGRTHYVRVRAINSSGTASGWSPVGSVDLDTDDPSQAGTVISDGAIYTGHIAANTILGTNIFGGTITATKMNANEIFATGIRLPSAADPDSAADYAAALTFNIDADGNMWWGDYDDIDAAITGAQKSYITAAGNATFVGEISTDTVGNARIVLADNTTGAAVDGGDSAGGYAYILGWTEQASEAIPGHAVWTDESGVAAGYFVAPRYHSGFNYSGVRLRDDNTTKAEAILVASTGSWAGVVKGADVGNYGAGAVTHADSSFVISTADGAYIYNSANAPSSTTNRLYSLSGSLYWGDDEIGSGSGDITAVNTATDSGLSGGAVSGVVGLNVDLSNLPVLTGSETLTTSDWVGIYDNDESQNNKVTIGDIVGLVPDDGIQSIVLNDGVAGSGLSGPTAVIYVDLNELNNNAPVAVGDQIVMTDSSTLNVTTRCSVQDLIDLVPDDGIQTLTLNAGVAGTGLSGPDAVIYVDMNELGTVAAATDDYVVITDTSVYNNTTRCTVQSIVDLASGGTTYTFSSPLSESSGTVSIDLSGYSPTSHTHSSVTGNLTLGGTYPYLYGNNLTVQATGNAYLRAGSGGNYGVTVWSGGETTIYNGTTANFKALGGYNQSLTIFPDVNATRNLGSSSKWWNYSYHYKMDTSALPGAAGSGWYMWFNTSDQVMKASSSERIKKDIVTIPTTEALDRIKALRPVEFSAKTNPSALVIDDMWEFKRYRGFIAEEAAAVDKDYGLYNWWKSDDPESEDYDKTLPSLSSLQDEWTDEEIAAYYDLDKAKPQMFDLHAILADSVAAIQALEARIAVLEG
jgi:hypothetical protein